MFTLFVNRSRGEVTTFGSAVTALIVSTLLPFSMVPGYIVPKAYAATPSLEPLSLPMPPASPEQNTGIPIQVLPEEMMSLLVGGPAVTRPAVNLEAPEVVLAGFSSTLPGLLASRTVSGAADSSVTALMDVVMASDSAGDVEDTIVLVLPVLAQYPDSHEARRAQILLEDRLSEATPAQLVSLASALMNSAAPTTPAEGLAACRVVATHARMAEALEVYDHVAATSTALLTTWPNAPEAYDAVALYLEALDVLGRATQADALRESLSGTLAAWRLTELQSGEAPSWDTLASSEACYGLLAAWHGQIQQVERAKETVDPAVVERGCALGELALWAYPNSAVQARIVPLYFDFLRRIPGEAQKSRFLELTAKVNTCASSISTWMVRIFIYREYLFHYYDRNSGAFHLMNAFDDLKQGIVDNALAAADVYDRDKARLEYYQGYSRFNVGDEQGAVVHYDRALGYEVTDVVADTALYARAFALEMVYDYQGAFDTAAQEYERYLAVHGYGRNAAHAVLALGRIYERAGDTEGAGYFFNYLLDHYPDSGLTAVASSAVERFSQDPSNAYARAQSAGGYATALQLCGPVALQKLLALSGIHAEVAELAAIAGTDTDGTTMQGLVHAAQAKGMSLVGVQAGGGVVLETPYIAFINNNHFVLVHESNSKEVLVDDIHASSPEWIPREAFGALWNGMALVKDSNAMLALALNQNQLTQVKGGQEDPLPEKNHMECQNWEFCCPCPPCAPPPSGGPGGPGGPEGPGAPNFPSPGDWISFKGASAGGGEPGFGNPGPGGPSGGTTNPSKCVKGANPEAMLFQVSPSVRETDLRMTTSSGQVLSLTRYFMTAYGYMRSWYSASPDVPYKNHIGNSWNHNYNMHLRPSQYYGSIMFVDEQGDIRTYVFEDDEGDYDIYTRQKPAHPWEQGVILKRHRPTGTYTAHFPDGRIYGFSQETDWDEHYARLEYIENMSGSRLTMQYDGQGRLYRVLPPAGDSRYLELQYNGNRVVQAQLRDASTVFQSITYVYDTYLNLTWVHRGNPSNDNNDISIYTYGSDPMIQYSYYMASRTDSAGVTTSMSYVYGQMYDWGLVATEMTFERGGLLKTHYKRFMSSVMTRVQNLDAYDVPINRIEYTGDAYGGNILSLVDYITPTSGSAVRWEYTYSSTDHLLTAVYRPNSISNGGTTALFEEFTYTPQGQYASVSRYAPGAPNNKLTTTFTYDTTGQLLVSRTGPDGLDTEYDYDNYGRLIQVTHPSLGVNGIQYTYDAQGNRASSTDPLGNTTTYAYDGRGNMTSITNALNQTTTMTYDDEGRVISVTDPLNNTTQYEYVDATCGCGGMGKIARITDALNQETEFEYDLAGNMILSRDALSRETAYEYDALNRMTAIESPAGSNKRMTFVYNRLGHLVSQTDFMGRTTTMTYDHQGRITSRTDPVDAVYYAYNAAGMLITVTDEEDQVTNYTYDAGMRPLLEYNGLYKFRKICYDAQGRVSSVGGGTDASIDPVAYSYSATTGLLTKTRYWSGATYHDADYVYDGAARVARINDWLDGTVGIQYAYDALGRLSTLTDYSLSKQLSYTYDAAGRIASMTDYNGHTTNYTYTARGELASITAPGSKVWNFSYNALGQRTQYTHPNGTRTEYGYDTQNRLTSIQHKDASTEAVLFGLSYTLNDGGNITRVDHNDASYWTYGYDNRDRLTAAERRNNLGALQHSFGYAYDNADNLTQRTRFQASNSQTDVWDYEYNAGNEQTKMILNSSTEETRMYDNWGRLATRTQGSYSASYAYRYGGRLYQATSNFPNESNVTFDYGGDGKLRTRTTASETRTYRYDRGWNAVNEEVSGATVASNVFEPGAQVGSILAQMLGTLASGAPVYAYHDHLATVRQWRFPNKNLARANEYDPYGNFYSYSGYLNMPRVYALHEFDLALQQYRAPYRNYSPSMARWTTLDPLGMVDGPNMYAYVGGRVINVVDGLGLFTQADCYAAFNVCYEGANQAIRAHFLGCFSGIIDSVLLSTCIIVCLLSPLPVCTLCFGGQVASNSICIKKGWEIGKARKEACHTNLDTCLCRAKDE